MAPQFTENVHTALEKAFSYAQEHQHTEVGENHLLLGFLEDPQGYFSTLSTSLNLNATALPQQIRTALAKLLAEAMQFLSVPGKPIWLVKDGSVEPLCDPHCRALLCDRCLYRRA